MTPINRVVRMIHQQPSADACVLDLRKFVRRQRRSKLPALTPHRVIAKATGKLTLGPINLAMQVISLNIADYQIFGIELIYAAADAVQIDQLLSSEPLDRSRWILLKRTSVVYFTKSPWRPIDKADLIRNIYKFAPTYLMRTKALA